jgi:hypothetical protein
MQVDLPCAAEQPKVRKEKKAVRKENLAGQRPAQNCFTWRRPQKKSWPLWARRPGWNAALRPEARQTPREGLRSAPTPNRRIKATALERMWRTMCLLL